MENRQSLFKTVPNYFGKTRTGKCMAGFNARRGGGVKIDRTGKTEEQIHREYRKLFPVDIILYNTSQSLYFWVKPLTRKGKDLFMLLVVFYDYYCVEMVHKMKEMGLSYEIIDEDVL